MLKKLKVGFVCARLGGLDGVSLEVDKWTRLLKQMGAKVFFCAGEVVPPLKGFNQISGKKYPELKNTKIIKRMRLGDNLNSSIAQHINTGKEVDQKNATLKAEDLARSIHHQITDWAKENKIDVLVAQNTNCLPVNIATALALSWLVDEMSHIKFIFHHHDFYWERDKSYWWCHTDNEVAKDWLDEMIQNDFNTIHITINRQAREELKKVKGINSIVIPNFFEKGIFKKDGYNKKIRKNLGLKKDDIVFLCPVRIVERKNIEAAIELVKKLKNPNAKLVIAGCPDFIESRYNKKLHRLAKKANGQVKFICSHLSPRRTTRKNKKLFTIFDTYTAADFVLYPSTYEGWGNALGEAMAAGLPVIVNRYPVFKTEIEPLGVRGIFMNNGEITNRLVKEILNLINDKKQQREIIEKNQEVIANHFSFAKYKPVFKQLFFE